jgi:septum site-determining protein MinD
MSRIIVITSGKGGVGKTTTAINLGAALNHFGEEALIIDGNLSTPNVGIHFGSPEVPVSLNHVLDKRVEAFEAVYEHDSGVRLIPASLSIKESSKAKHSKLKDFKKDFSDLSNYIIVDSAAGLGEEALSAIDLADEIIIVTNPEMPAITDALKTIKTAEERNKKILGVIMTRIRKDKLEMNPETVKDMLETKVIGMIPEDLSLKEALNLKDAIVHTHPHSKAARAYKEIAAKLLEIDYDSDRDKESLMKRLLNKFGLK